MRLNIAQNDAATAGEEKPVINVFYDGKCGLCSREIRHYQTIAPNGVFQWHDVTEPNNQLDVMGLTLAETLRILHVIDHFGETHRGVDAFIVIWDHLPRWRVLASICRLPLIRALARKLYQGFAQWRFNRLPHCQLAKDKAKNVSLH